MSAIIRFLIISAAIIVPWAIIRLADLEVTVIALFRRLNLSDLGVIALVILPPAALFTVKWLLGPRTRRNKGYSNNRNLLIKFRG